VERTPVWFMRQAGRYMPAYRELRARFGILEIIKSPELSVEVTLQPLRAFDLDAAIIFADILPLLEGMGLALEFVRGEGPLIRNPLRSAGQIDRLADEPVEEGLSATLEAIGLVRRALDRRTALIGFAGAPFTLACYAIEGGASQQYLQAKGLMAEEPAAWHRLMARLAERVGRYLTAQVGAGAQVVQLFDSWAGVLSPADYRSFVLPHSRRVLEVVAATGAPVIHFGTGTAGFLEEFAAAGGDVVGVDWRIDLDRAWRRIGATQAIQGNLDPAALLAPWPVLQQQADLVLAAAAHRDGHIFNLGHGIPPEAPADQVARLVDHVHAVTARRPTA
jgi:uroporphyrinogen decarboxylase